MSQLATPYGSFKLLQFENENNFERAVVAHVNQIFGDRCIYLDCTRRIGSKNGKRGVPDAYPAARLNAILSTVEEWK